MAITFAAAPGGSDWGLLEVIEDAVSLRKFDFASVEQFNEQHLVDFIRTTAGGLIAGFL